MQKIEQREDESEKSRIIAEIIQSGEYDEDDIDIILEENSSSDKVNTNDNKGEKLIKNK